jgi:ferrochelatase
MTQYKGESDYAHGTAPSMGVLLVNLGTPDAPTPAAVRRYLAEFLSDPRVIEAPAALWWLILHGVILRIRPRRSARLYQKVWTEEGAPLLAISKRQVAALQKALDTGLRGPVKVALGMRYGNPSIADGLEILRRADARRILILPLYPQYSATTTASTFDAVADVLKRWRWLPALRMVDHYHDHPFYIRALAASIQAHWKRHGRSERLLFSFHGIPKRYLEAGDPYHCECRKTARLVAEALRLPEGSWQVSFQSRVGREEWLKPYTDQVLAKWPAQGVKSVDVVCPGFSADCLETLEEIAEENREVFLSAGGESYRYIPALNDSPSHIELLADLALANGQGWPEISGDYDPDRQARAGADSLERARALGSVR